MDKTIRIFRLMFLFFFIYQHASICQNTTHMVKDIWPGLGDLYSSPTPYHLIDINGKLFFFNSDSLDNLELWRSDGTETGTLIIKNTGTHYCDDVINSNGTIFFLTSDSLKYMELWKSDGNEVNTIPLQQMQTDGLNPGFTNFNQTVIFSAFDDLHGTELWKINDTHSGADILKDIYPGSKNSGSGYLNVTNGNLYFSANDGTNGFQLWKSNGTETGTNIVTIIPASLSFPSGAFISYLTTVGQNVFFLAIDSLHGAELWKSDGTEEGTNLVKDIRLGIDFGLSSYITEEHPFTEMNKILYFPANDGVHGFELWRSDGTEMGTYMLKDINPGNESSFDYTYHDWLIPNIHQLMVHFILLLTMEYMDKKFGRLTEVKTAQLW